MVKDNKKQILQSSTKKINKNQHNKFNDNNSTLSK